MSTSCTHVELLSCDAALERADIERLFAKHEDELPEDCFLDELAQYLKAHAHDKQRCRFKTCRGLSPHDAQFCMHCSKRFLGRKTLPLPLTNLSWLGEGSSHSFDEVFVKHIAPCIKGELQAIFTWDSGVIDGVAIKNGKVAVCEVVQSLKLPRDW